MNYIDRIAYRIHEELEPYKIMNADDFPLYRLYALLLLTKGVNVTLEDVHNAWSVWTITRNPQHPSLKEFCYLTPEVQELDRPYTMAIRKVAEQLGLAR